MSIRSLHPEERPREKLSQIGAVHLNSVDLLAILLGSGNKNSSVLELSRLILAKYTLQDLSGISQHALQKIPGVGKVKSGIILAAIELGRRSLAPLVSNESYITSPALAATHLVPYLQGNQEKLVVLFLTSRKQIISTKTLFIGTIDKQLISSRDIVKHALDLDAVSVIISHNHPSGNINPSDSDIVTTKQVMLALNMFNISLEDHIIIAGNEYYSFAENKVL